VHVVHVVHVFVPNGLLHAEPLHLRRTGIKDARGHREARNAQ